MDNSQIKDEMKKLKLKIIGKENYYLHQINNFEKLSKEQLEEINDMAPNVRLQILKTFNKNLNELAIVLEK
jgi:hypothetical protein